MKKNLRLMLNWLRWLQHPVRLELCQNETAIRRLMTEAEVLESCSEDADEQAYYLALISKTHALLAQTIKTKAGVRRWFFDIRIGDEDVDDEISLIQAIRSCDQTLGQLRADMLILG